MNLRELLKLSKDKFYGVPRRVRHRNLPWGNS